MIQFYGFMALFLSCLRVLRVYCCLALLLFPLCLQASEVKEIGEKLRKQTSLMFSSKELLTSDELTPNHDKGKTFDPQIPPPIAPIAEVTKATEKGRTIEKIDEAESFLQMSQKITSDPSSFTTGLKLTDPLASTYMTSMQTCEEAVSRVITIEQKRHIETIPAVKENRKICNGHTQNFVSQFPTKKSAKKLKKEIQKNIGENIELIGIKIDGRNVIASYRHKNPETFAAVEANKIHTGRYGCFNYKTEEITIQSEQKVVSWKASDSDLLSYLESAEHCYLAGNSKIHEESRSLVFRCEKGEDSRCQRIREAKGILIDKECIETDPAGECVIYLKTFEIHNKQPLINQQLLDTNDLDFLEDFETISEIDPDFGEAVSRLAAISEVRGNVEDEINLMEAEVFPGNVMRCKRGCSRDYLYDCCGDPKGWLLGNGASCNKDEEKLFQNRKDKKCHYIGTRDLKFGLEKEQVYICYPSILSRAIQEGGRKQLRISWGTAETPNIKGLVLGQIGEIDMEKVDLSDFEVSIKKSIDVGKIMEKIQSTFDSFDPSQAKRQTENLLKEDVEKCGF